MSKSGSSKSDKPKKPDEPQSVISEKDADAGNPESSVTPDDKAPEDPLILEAREETNTPSSETNGIEDAEILSETPPEDASEGPKDDEGESTEENSSEPLQDEDQPRAEAEEATEAQVESPEPETSPEPAPSAPLSGGVSSGVASVVPLILGGVIAALIGFLVARYGENAQSTEPTGPTPEELAAAIEAADARVTALQAEIEGRAGLDAMSDVEARISTVSTDLDRVSQDIQSLSQTLTDLSDRVETIALRPVATGIEPEEFDAALDAFRTELSEAIANAQSEIEEARAEAEQISEQAFAAEQSAVLQAAWSQIAGAIQNGVPFQEPLSELSEGTEVPGVLVENAESGVPSATDLQDAFPTVARNALRASIQAESGDTALERFNSFLRVQSGVRSLEPREGDDPDAILSRAEAAVRAGDFGAALAEIDGLPEAGQAAMTEWVARARTRLAALEAVDAVRSGLNSN